MRIDQEEANYVELGEEEEMLLMSYVEMSEAKREDVWFLDSGCNNHMCGDKALFCDFNESFRQMVKLGNNSRMLVIGKGNVTLKVNGFNHIVIESDHYEHGSKYAFREEDSKHILARSC